MYSNRHRPQSSFDNGRPKKTYAQKAFSYANSDGTVREDEMPDLPPPAHHFERS